MGPEYEPDQNPAYHPGHQLDLSRPRRRPRRDSHRNGTKFVKVCDVLLPKKKYPDLDRDDHKACAEELDSINEFDLDLTDAQRDKLIKNGPDIFSIFRVSKVEIV